MVDDSRAHISKSILGVSKLVVKDYRTVMLIKEMEISSLMTHTQNFEKDSIKEKERETNKVTKQYFDKSQKRLGDGNYF